MLGYFHIILLKLNCELTKRGEIVHRGKEKKIEKSRKE